MMKVQDVSISLNEDELYTLTLAMELYQDELKNIYTDEDEYEERKDKVDIICDELYKLGKIFRKEQQ